MPYVGNCCSGILFMLVRNHSGDDIGKKIVILDEKETDEGDREKSYSKT